MFDAYFLIIRVFSNTLETEYYDLLLPAFVAPFRNTWSSDILYDIASSSSSKNQTIANVKLGQCFRILRFKSKGTNLQNRIPCPPFVQIVTHSRLLRRYRCNVYELRAVPVWKSYRKKKYLLDRSKFSNYRYSNSYFSLEHLIIKYRRSRGLLSPYEMQMFRNF